MRPCGSYGSDAFFRYRPKLWLCFFEPETQSELLQFYQLSEIIRIAHRLK